MRKLHLGTLQLDEFSGKVFLLGLVFLLVGIAAGEVLLPTDLARRVLPVPSISVGFRDADLKLARLDQLQRQGKTPDCLVLGSSMTLLGFDVDEFSRVYNQQTGRDVTCFNFALNGVSGQGAAAMAKILTKRYSPQMVIYATDVRALIPIESVEEWGVFLTRNPWFTYQLGTFSFKGWLISHSYSYRQLLAFAYWRQPLANWYYTAADLKNYDGFAPVTATTTDVTLPPDGQIEFDRRYKRWMADYRILPEELAALDEFTQLKAQGIEVYMVEMPSHATFIELLGNGEADYVYYVETMEAFSQESGVPFLPTSDLNLIPDAQWTDRQHLKKDGAALFSSWVAEQLAGYGE